MQGASKDVADLVKEMLSQPALSQTSESIQEVPIAEEEKKLMALNYLFQMIFLLPSLGILLALLAHLPCQS